MILVLNEFMKLGQVVEVRGQKISIRVFENKNGPILLYKGDIIKNVSVGSFIKIPKGYMSIIGKIEGEHISELQGRNMTERFQKESDSIERIIDVSVLGVVEHGVFQKSVMEIPLVFSDAYILEEHELQMVFSFFRDKENAIALGNIVEYKNYKLNVDAQLLFASHIGIFGNTGSGKSNTLATLYTGLFQKYENKKNFKKSRFLILDFNNEYSGSFTDNKKVYHLSTRNQGGDKIKIPIHMLESLDFWSIICEASMKVQRPFLERVIQDYKEILHHARGNKAELLLLLEQKVKELFLCCYREGKSSVESHNDLTELFEILFREVGQLRLLDCKFKQETPREVGFMEEVQGVQSEMQFVEHMAEPIMRLLTEDNLKDVDSYDYFAFAMKYREIYETIRRFVLGKYMEPMTKRFEMRLKNVRKIFEPVKNKEDDYNVEVISLLDVNVEFKKLIPMILCKTYYDRQKNRKVGSLHIIMDEAHHILHEDMPEEEILWKDYCRGIFEEIIKEGRKFGAFLTIASQRPADISESMISQLQNYFIHRIVNKDDILVIGKAVMFLDASSFDMISVLPQGACIFAGAASNFPVMVQMDQVTDEFMIHSDTIELIRFWNGEK